MNITSHEDFFIDTNKENSEKLMWIDLDEECKEIIKNLYE